MQRKDYIRSVEYAHAIFLYRLFDFASMQVLFLCFSTIYHIVFYFVIGFPGNGTIRVFISIRVYDIVIYVTVSSLLGEKFGFFSQLIGHFKHIGSVHSIIGDLHETCDGCLVEECTISINLLSMQRCEPQYLCLG